MALRKIITVDDNALHTKCKEIVKFDDSLQEFVNDLIETLHSVENAVGLASPQVGILKRVAIVDVGKGPFVLINPVITETKGSVVGVEGCLSFPDRWARVQRPAYVKVKTFDEKGNVKFFEGEGLLACAFCHEIDHLDGVVFLDKGEELSLAELNELQKNFNNGQ